MSWPFKTPLYNGVLLGSATTVTIGMSMLLGWQVVGAEVLPRIPVQLPFLSQADTSQQTQVKPKSDVQLALDTSGLRGNLLGMSPNLVADVAESVAAAVVNIDVESKNQMQGRVFEGIPGFRFYFGGPGGMSPFGPEKISGNGSGVVLDTQGHILTNNHVISTADTITVTLQDGRKVAGKVIGRDAATDLAVIKIDAPNLSPATLGDSANARPGEWVLAVGSPLGFDHTVTIGIISAKSRRVPDLSSSLDFIQTDAAINPGNSGGPLVNLKGEVIGINTAISGRGQNIGFAIPVEVVKEVATALIQSGEIKRPWIGLGMTPLNEELAKSLGLDDKTQGVIISQVMPNSPASKAGFQPGDVIQRVDGKVIKEAKEIQEMVKSKPVNGSLNIQILRNGQLMAKAVQTEQLPSQPQEEQPVRQQPQQMSPFPSPFPW